MAIKHSRDAMWKTRPKVTSDHFELHSPLDHNLNSNTICWGKTSGPLRSVMGFKHKRRTNIIQKLKLIGRGFNFIFNPMNLFNPM